MNGRLDEHATPRYTRIYSLDVHKTGTDLETGTGHDGHGLHAVLQLATHRLQLRGVGARKPAAHDAQGRLHVHETE